MNYGIDSNDFYDEQSRLIFKKRKEFFEKQDTHEGWYALLELIAQNYKNQFLQTAQGDIDFRFLEKIKDSDKKVVIFGCGFWGQRLQMILKYIYKIDIYRFMDNNCTQGQIVNEVEVVKPVALADMFDDCLIIVPEGSYAKEMQTQLTQLGVAADNFMSVKQFNIAPVIFPAIEQYIATWQAALVDRKTKFYIYNTWHHQQLFSLLLKKAGMNFAAFVVEKKDHETSAVLDYPVIGLDEMEINDENSVVICLDSEYLRLISKTEQTGRVIPISNNDSIQYFDSDVVPKQDTPGVFIDGGALNMDTAIQYLNWCGDKEQKILSFEPDEHCYNNCKARIENDPALKGVATVYNKGLWSKAKTLKFYQTDLQGASYITDTDMVCEHEQCVKTENEVVLDCVAIDDMLEGGCTFIKMDIEGSELEALKGARNTISKHSPILAISIYHKPEDIIEIPSYIKSINSEYRFYLRSYHMDYTEIVFYAIPKTMPLEG